MSSCEDPSKIPTEKEKKVLISLACDLIIVITCIFNIFLEQNTTFLKLPSYNQLLKKIPVTVTSQSSVNTELLWYP